jgi:hypothetical protein
VIWKTGDYSSSCRFENYSLRISAQKFPEKRFPGKIWGIFVESRDPDR